MNELAGRRYNTKKPERVTRKNSFILGVLGIALVATLASAANAACELTYNINLQTFGEGVRVELRTGALGNSKVVNSSFSRGGQVGFYRLCPGNYFLTIGNDDSVSVTQVNYCEDDAEYSSSITLQRGTGNGSKRSRNSL